MNKQMSLMQFLNKLAICSGDEAIEIVSKFQSGGLYVEGIGVEEAEEYEENSRAKIFWEV